MKPVYLYVVPFFPSSESWRGGFFLDVAKALIRDGRYDVRVMTVSTGEDYQIDGIDVVRFKTVKLGCSDYFPLVTDKFKIRAFSRKLAEMSLAPKDIAVCHVNEIECMAFYGQWLKIRNGNCCFLVHHHWSGIYALPGGRMNRIGLCRDIEMSRIRQAYAGADLHIFCSEKCRDAFMPFDMRFKNESVIYNGIDAGLFNSGKKRLNNGKQFKIGCVGNFTPTKSQMTLVEAFSLAHEKMPGAELVFVGTGRERGECEAAVQKNGLMGKVRFENEVNHQKLPDFYRTLDLFVLPSYLEAFNCTLIEAWACGVPCMTTDAISFKEVLPRGEWDKWLFRAKDSAALADKLVWAYANRPARQPLLRNIDIDTIVRELLDLVEEERLHRV